MASSLNMPPRASRADFEALSSDKYPPAVRLIVLLASVLGSWCLFYGALWAAGF